MQLKSCIRMKSRELIRPFAEDGWNLDRIRGSHHIMVKPGKRAIPIPIHGNQGLPKGIVSAILRQAGLKKENGMEFAARIFKSGSEYLVAFPEFPNINTHGSTLEEAMANAEEALNGTLESEFERGYVLPAPRIHAQKRSLHAIPVHPHIEIAYALKKMRNGQSQSDIARKLGITYQSYQKLENPRKCNPTVKTLERIGAVLGKRLVLIWK